MARKSLKAYALGTALLAALSSMPLSAQAAITVFHGEDQGAAIAGPFTNSDAAQTSFLGAASGFGSVRTETFGSLAVGTASLGGTFAIPGAHVTLVTPFVPPFGGVSNGTTGSSNIYGFPIHGETNWLAFDEGTATFNFNSASHSFGFYTTGVQNDLTSTFTVSFNDGAAQSLNVPILTFGGASYFGFTDTSGFNSVTITNLDPDAWGLSDASFNFASGVPEPASWALFILGFGGIGVMMRRSRDLKALAAG